MSLDPSANPSAALTGRKPFAICGGLGKHQPALVDQLLTDELIMAGIDSHKMPESFRERHGGEVYTVIVGSLHGWTFKRAWHYWIAEGPGIPIQYAMEVHKHHGMSVRVGGMAGGYSPLEWAKGFPITNYHIDNAEGLVAFAEVIRRIKSAGDALAQQATAAPPVQA